MASDEVDVCLDRPVSRTEMCDWTGNSESLMYRGVAQMIDIVMIHRIGCNTVSICSEYSQE